jgi:hypothetical protein
MRRDIDRLHDGILSGYTDADLLAELVNRLGVTPAPQRREYRGPWSEVVASIGPDHSAVISMDDSTLVQLQRMTDIDIDMTWPTRVGRR